MAAVGGRLLVMYGQTEAAPRMATLPAGTAADKLGSVGRALPGGRFTVLEAGEVVYAGPNVMMGYAETASRSGQRRRQRRRAATGDLGQLDAEGFLFLTGRLAGSARSSASGSAWTTWSNWALGRSRLDAVGAVPAATGSLSTSRAPTDATRRCGQGSPTGSACTTPGSSCEHRGLPLLPSGKIDYRALEASL